MSNSIALWHYLSKKRLEQKNAFAKENAGQLLLMPPEKVKDISEGKAGSFLYCLGNPLGGMDFSCSDADELCLIKITLFSNARIFSFEGNPSQLDYVEVAENYDVIDMMVPVSPDWPARFRQFLLLNNTCVRAWTGERGVIEGAFTAYHCRECFPWLKRRPLCDLP